MTLPGSSGLLELELANDHGGRTCLVRRAQRFPLRLTVPLYLDAGDEGMAFLYVQNPTGGVFAEDRLDMSVEVGPGARAHLTTTSATKVYRMEQGRAESCLDLTLAEGSYLEVVPEPLIPQAGSRLSQEVKATLAAGAGLVATEIVSPGRVARGELFAYDGLTLRTTLADPDGRELCTDLVLLEPDERSPARRGLLGRRPYLASVLVAAPGRDADELAAALDAAVRDIPGTLAGAGALPNGAGALARILAATGGAARAGLDAAWGAARGALLGRALPPRRK